MTANTEKTILNKNPSGDPTNTVDESHIDIVVKALEINMFFDGTWNNMFNNNAYRAHKPEDMAAFNDAQKTWNLIESGSYARIPTAIEWMYKAFDRKSDPMKLAVYIEGAGTEGLETDNPVGASFGTGDTGIVAKREKSFELINKEIENLSADEKKGITCLQINAYGFSRGAATARSFCTEARKHSEKFTGLKLSSSQVQIVFVGIFDTVSAVGLNIYDDVQEFGLEVPRCKRVVHITAQDEARTMFALTSIQRAVEAGYGFQVGIPGCHTDIGGGLGSKIERGESGAFIDVARNENRDLTREQRRYDEYGVLQNPPNHSPTDFSADPDMGSIGAVLRAKSARNNIDGEAMRQHLIDKGWYLESQIKWTEPMVSKFRSGMTSYRKLKGERLQLKLDYPKVPTNMMVEFIKKYEADHFIKNNLTIFEVPGELKDVYDDLWGQANAKDIKGKGAMFAANITNDARSKQIYNQYLHFSSDGSLAFDGQFNPDGSYNRTIILGKGESHEIFG